MSAVAWFMIMAVLPGLYVASVVYLVAGGDLDAVLGTGLLAMSVYLLHRLSRRVPPRSVVADWTAAGLAAIASVIVLWQVHPFAAVLVPCAITGVLIYGRRVVLRPLREITLLNPIIVATSIAAIACAVSPSPLSSIAVAGPIAVVIVGDALLCDLVDIPMDRASGTVTIPMRLSIPGTWLLASVSNSIAGVWLVAIDHSTLALLILVSYAVVWVLRPVRLRMVVDGRLPLVALVASLT